MKSEFYIETLEKIKSYCAYQERCEFEVIEKLKMLGINKTDTATIISELEKHNFLDNARFAEAFASGKNKIKGWGKVKIKIALKSKRVSEELITEALDQIDSNDYRERLNDQALKKFKLLGHKKDRNTRQKLFRFLYGKGYETEYIEKTIKLLWER